MDTSKNADKLLFRNNLSAETIQKMKETRKLAYDLAAKLDSFGSSSELTLAFRHVQNALFLANAHLCYVDSQATLEQLI